MRRLATPRSKLREASELISGQGLAIRSVRFVADLLGPSALTIVTEFRRKTIAAFEDIFEKTGVLGTKIDLVLAIVRMGLFYGDKQLIKKHIERAKTLVESGGDWDRRNRLKAYEDCISSPSEITTKRRLSSSTACRLSPRTSSAPTATWSCTLFSPGPSP